MVKMKNRVKYSLSISKRACYNKVNQITGVHKMKNKNDITNFVRKYTESAFIDMDNMHDYLERNLIVGNEIFMYCDRGVRFGGDKAYCELLDTRTGFYPISQEMFIRRIPFYYYGYGYLQNDIRDRKTGTLGELLRNVIEESSETELEAFYNELEYLFYTLEIPLEEIFGYVCEQEGDMDYTLFSRWIEYVHLCEKLGWSDYTPECLIYNLNRALEEDGQEPYMYPLIPFSDGSLIDREGLYINMQGRFPVDENEEIVLKWIEVKMENVSGYYCDCYASHIGMLTIRILPDSMIYAKDPLLDSKWINVYAGPLKTKFDYTVLKRARMLSGMTQLEVAEAIGANVRTYQKWEAGNTVPDGFYLLRLFNWFNIKDMEEVIVYDE